MGGTTNGDVDAACSCGQLERAVSEYPAHVSRLSWIIGNAILLWNEHPLHVKMLLLKLVSLASTASSRTMVLSEMNGSNKCKLQSF